MHITVNAGGMTKYGHASGEFTLQCLPAHNSDLHEDYVERSSDEFDREQTIKVEVARVQKIKIDKQVTVKKNP